MKKADSERVRRAHRNKHALALWFLTVCLPRPPLSNRTAFQAPLTLSKLQKQMYLLVNLLLSQSQKPTNSKYHILRAIPSSPNWPTTTTMSSDCNDGVRRLQHGWYEKQVPFEKNPLTTRDTQSKRLTYCIAVKRWRKLTCEVRRRLSHSRQMISVACQRGLSLTCTTSKHSSHSGKRSYSESNYTKVHVLEPKLKKC